MIHKWRLCRSFGLEIGSYKPASTAMLDVESRFVHEHLTEKTRGNIVSQICAGTYAGSRKIALFLQTHPQDGVRDKLTSLHTHCSLAFRLSLLKRDYK